MLSGRISIIFRIRSEPCRSNGQWRSLVPFSPPLNCLVSKENLSPQLNDSGRGRRSNCSEGGTAVRAVRTGHKGGVGHAEIDMICGIDELRADLKREPLPQRQVLNDRHVQIKYSRTRYVRQRSGQIAIRITGRIYESGRVEPLVFCGMIELRR